MDPSDADEYARMVCDVLYDRAIGWSVRIQWPDGTVVAECAVKWEHSGLFSLVSPAFAGDTFYDSSGHFAGGATAHTDGISSFFDRDGRFVGSSIRNSDGTTSFYDGRRHFSKSKSK